MSATLWRPVLTVAAFSLLPFAVFVNDNRSQGVLDLDLVLYSLFLLVPGLVLVVLIGRTRGRTAAERAAVVFAAAAFVLFHFQAAESLAELVSGSDAVAVAVWLALFAAAVVLALRLSVHSLAWNYMLVAGALLLALPVLQYVYFEATEEAPAADGGPALELSAAPPPDELPDVYFFLLDGYGRADQLEEIIGFDNRRFLGALRKRDFAVHDAAGAAYPTTFLSLASTLEMGYPVTGGELTDYAPYFEAMGGDNETVRAFEQLGYRFAMGTDYSSLECGDAVDQCVEPPTDAEGVGGERESAILAATPLATVLPELGISFRPLSGYLSPEDLVDAVEAERTEAPVFAYGHLLTPHPPYRYLESCELRTDLSDRGLDLWGEAEGEGGEGYRQAVECVNASLLRSVERILAADPDAVIVIQGDHGPKFDGMNFHRPLEEWTEAELVERFSLLSAARLPRGCDAAGPRAQLAVNTFRIVLGCLAGAEPELLPPRRFMIDLEAGEVEPIESGPGARP